MTKTDTFSQLQCSVGSIRKYYITKSKGHPGQWWHMPIISALERQKKTDLYRASSRTGFKVLAKPCLGKLKQKQTAKNPEKKTQKKEREK